MPASSLSLSFATSLYLLFLLLFIALLLAPVRSITQASEVEAANSLLDGIQSEVNSVVPGMSAALRYDLGFQGGFPISFHNHSIAALVNQHLLVKHVRWLLPDISLKPGDTYLIGVSRGELTFEKTRLS